MKKCILCNSTSLLKSQNESSIMKGCHYMACNHCGNVMIEVDDKLIPTPTTDNDMTKAMIEDAAKSFGRMGQALQSVSLTADKNMEPHMQPTTVKENMQRYIEQHLHSSDDEEEYEDFDNCEYENEDFYRYEEKEEADKELSLETAEMLRIDESDYLIIVKTTGERHLYRNCSRDFVLSIINSMGKEVELFELKKIPLKTEVKYSF